MTEHSGLSFAKTGPARLMDVRARLRGSRRWRLLRGPQSASPGAGLADKISEDPERPAER
jgi:hypothetical protein